MVLSNLKKYDTEDRIAIKKTLKNNMKNMSTYSIFLVLARQQYFEKFFTKT